MDGVSESVLTAGAGFLLAVIWMDLMFDVLALGAREGGRLPESSLAQIAGYYRRVTTTASPMNLLISAVMATMVVILAMQIARGSGSRAGVSLALCGVPIVLALLRVFPNAIRLGSRSDSDVEQSRLARSICIDHVLCFVAMLAFLAVRLTGQ